MRRPLLPLLLWLAFSCGAYAADTLDKARDPVRLLYSSRVLFEESGEPEIAVGLMTGQREMSFEAQSGLVLAAGEGRQSRHAVRPGERVEIRLRSSHPAKSVWRVLDERFAPEDQAARDAAMQALMQQGFSPSVWRTGTSLAFKGRLLDNSLDHLVVAEVASAEEAQHLAESYGAKIGRELRVEDEVMEPPSGTFEVRIGRGKRARAFLVTDWLRLHSGDDSPITVRDCHFGQGFAGAGQANMAFRGTLYVTLDRDGKLALGNILGLESLLRGIVPSEMFTQAPLEALKAQAIAARGQLLAKLGTRHLGDPFVLCATQHCQVYRGRSAETPSTDRAVRETRGQFLVDGRRLVDTVFSALSGGFGENNDAVWDTPPDPHLRGTLDGPPDPRFANGIDASNLDAFLDHPPATFSARTGYNQDKLRWNRHLAAERLHELSARLGLGAFRNLRVLTRGVSGRATSLEWTGEKGAKAIRGELAIRRLLDNLPSSLARFMVSRTPNGELAGLEIKGAGYGHGVGLCQTGAIGRAQAGQQAPAILKHYYGDRAELETLY